MTNDEAPPPGPSSLSVRERQWLKDNREAIASYNDWIAEYGVPLEAFFED